MLGILQGKNASAVALIVMLNIKFMEYITFY